MDNFVPPEGSLDAKIMLIGECPGIEEVYQKRPFVGRCGKLLDKILKDAGIKRESCYITNVVKQVCRTGNKNRPPTEEEIVEWGEGLRNEITSSKCRVIVTLGKTPTRFLLGCKKTFNLGELVGKIYRREITDAHIIPSYHPSWLLQYGKQEIIETTSLFKKIGKTYGK